MTRGFTFPALPPIPHEEKSRLDGSAAAAARLVDYVLRQRSGEKNGKYSLTDFFSEEQAANIKLKMIEQCQAAPSKDAAAAFLQETMHKLDEVALRARKFHNVKRQEFEIRRFELAPGEVDMQEYFKQIVPLIPFRSSGASYRHWEHGFGSDVPALPSKEWVANNERPICHTEPVGAFYRNAVFDARATTFQDLSLAREELQAWVTDRRELSSEEVKGIRTINPRLQTLSNVGEASLAGLIKVLNWAGQGTLSHPAAEDSNRFKELMRFRSELAAQSVFKSATGGGSIYLKSLAEMQRRLRDSKSILDQAEFAEMQNIIANEIAETNKVNEEVLKDFNDRMKQVNATMLETLQGDVDKEADMWKYRVIQVLLLLTPVGGLSLFGHVFSYIDPLMNIFGPIMNPALDFGQGLAQVGGNVPVFGQIFDALEIDQVVEWAGNNLPILKEFGGLFDTITNSGIAQNLGGVVSPAMSSPILTLGIAGLVSLMRTDTEVQHHIKKVDHVDAQKEILRKEFESLDRVLMGDKLKKRVAEFTARSLNASRNADLAVELSRFMVGMNKKELEIFDGLECEVDGKKTTIIDLASVGKVKNEQQVIEILTKDKNKNVRNEFMERYMAYKALCLGSNGQDKRDISEIVDELTGMIRNKPDKVGELAVKKAQEHAREFMEEYSKLHGLRSAFPIDSKDPKESEECREARLEARRMDLERQVILGRVKQLSHDYQIPPSFIVEQPKGGVLGNVSRDKVAGA